ncbi:MAG: hypothetical protein RBR78_05270 [Flavobacteriaceae bacterium]|jgi:hypothetical protein|nr:hypothetical protein [Flavobacteriaceae bacterium]
MKKIFFIALLFVTAISCDDYDPGVTPPASLSFQHAAQTMSYMTESATREVKVFSTLKSNVDRTVQVEILTGDDAANQPYSTAEEGDFTVSSLSVVIPAGEYSGSFNISFNPDLPVTASRYVTFGIVTPDDLVLNKTKDKIKISYNRLCLSNTIVYNLTLDPWGSETTWEIKNSSGVVVQQGGPYSDGTDAAHPQPTMTFTLDDGSYTFTIYDAYGDGMAGSTTAGTAGSYNIAKDCGSVLVQGGGNFGAVSNHSFSLP